MNGTEPHERCGAKNRRGGVCGRGRAPGRTRCNLHGGKTPVGVESPHFKTGRYSRFMPSQLREKFRLSQEDRALGSLRDDIAVTDAMILDALAAMEGKKGKAFAAAREVVLDIIERKRRLAESEAQRLKDAHQLISVQKALAISAALVNVIADNVKDINVVRIVRQEFERLTA